MTIEWKDRRGRLNVLVLEPIDFAPLWEPIPPHRFDPRRYCEGVTDTCWCRGKADHPIHLTKRGTPRKR